MNKMRNFWQKINKSAGFKSFLAALLAIACGLLLGLIVMIITNPSVAFPAFFQMIGGWVFRYGSKEIGNWLYYGAPLLLAGLSVGFAFKTGLFNIGASGQYTVGMFCALFVGIAGDALGSMQWIVALIAGIAGGAIWGFIPGFLKAYFNVNEVISSIMLNYIGLYMVDALVLGLKTSSGASLLYDSLHAETINMNSNAFLPTIGLRSLFPGSAIDIGFIIAIIAAIIAYFILNKTNLGYELKACGFNRNAARYGGINEKKNIILAMTIAGALAGLGGAVYMQASGSINLGMHYTADGSLNEMGFNGIAVALLGMSNPIGIIFASGFITFIQRGGNFAQIYGYKTEIVSIIISIIVYFSAFSLLASELIRRFIKRRKDKKSPPPDDSIIEAEAKTDYTAMSQGKTIE